MNAVNSNLKEEIKKSREGIKKEKFKFIASLLLSNLLVALLCLSFNQKNHPPTEVKNQKTLHPTHQMMIIPLNSLLIEDHASAKETPVTLISRTHKVIIKKAYLHQFLKKEDELSYFKIEINDADIAKISTFLGEGMIAIPFVETQKKTTMKQQGSKYEVAL